MGRLRPTLYALLPTIKKIEQGRKINVFDIEIAVNDKDPRIKPGMSASSRIVMEKVPDVVHIPLEAVFEKEGELVVYLDNREKRAVEVGRRNNMEIEIISGLEGDERVCLVDPTLEEPGMPGDKATEPEINKGRRPVKRRPNGQ